MCSKCHSEGRTLVIDSRHASQSHADPSSKCHSEGRTLVIQEIMNSPSHEAEPEVSSLFSRESGWPTFFYILACLNIIGGSIIAFSGNPVVGLVAGLSSCLTCVFFAFVSQLLVDIRWLLSRK